MRKNIKSSGAAGPVLFPHWVHRTKYTCKVCHTELGFPMKAGETNIRQSDIEAGRYCGKCHNGTEAFGPDKCIRCHSWGITVKENSRIEYSLKGLPQDDFGNGVNWVEALRKGKIKPRASLHGKGKMTIMKKEIVIPATKFSPHPPDVNFPHKAHTELLDCASCHPRIFEPKKGGNPKMNMMKIISGKYCGVCHNQVAFPLEDCFRCHSQPVQVPEWIKDKDKKKDDKDKKKDKKKVEEKDKKKKKKKGFFR